MKDNIDYKNKEYLTWRNLGYDKCKQYIKTHIKLIF